MRIGLVLGAGGVVGGSWMAGALQGLSEELDWDPAGAERIVGTSVGAMVGALLGYGVAPSYLAAHCAGEQLDGVSAALSRAEASRDELRERRAIADLAPGSWRLGLASLARAHRSSPVAMLAGWLPCGRTGTVALKDAVRIAAAHGAEPPRGFQAVACDYMTAERAALDASHAPLADVVAASCAIPGFYRPVAIAGRRFVDGAVHSCSNLDLLAGRGLDLVICLNPMSSLHTAPARTLWERALAAVRADAGRRLGREARAVRDAGTETLILQPGADDLDAMASGRGRRHVVETARAGVRAVLRPSSGGFPDALAA